MKKFTLLLFSLLLSSILLAGVYSGGSGTSSDPYRIAIPDDLIELSNTSVDWDKHFIQTADITWDSGQNWGLIGSYTDLYDNVPFTGVYDGGEHTITDLNINLPSNDGVAFIAYTDGAEIRNLGLVNVSVIGSQYVSALVGRTDNSTMISNCFSTGAISSGSYYGGIGGLIGYHAGSSSIENSYSMASITGTYSGGTRSLGGLIGSTHTSSVTNCYSTGAVSGGTVYVGGLIGYSMATVSNSFWDTESSGQVTSAAGTGKTTAEMQEASLFIQAGWDFMDESENGTYDFWGMNSADNNGYPFLSWQEYTNEPELLLSTQHVTNISTSALTATANGTIYSLGDPAPTQHGVCWNTTGNPTLADNFTEEGAPTTGSFTTEISGLSLNEVYYVRAYATNSNETVYGNEVSFAMTSAVAPAAGNGSEAAPYEIANLENLLWLSENNSEWNKYFIQTADIDASATQHINHGSGFSPIGNDGVKFTGNYNGQYHTIDGFYINRPSTDGIGLFGYVNSSGTIKNLGVINANVTGSSNIGSLVGQLYSSYSFIENCYSTGTVTGLSSYTGGLIGWLAYGTMNNCYGDMEVLGASYTGSLAGRIQGGEVNNCYSHGSAAKNPNTSSMTSVGGFAGAIDNSSTVNHCFSTASVGNGNNRGGFVAYFSNATVTNCFWDTQTSGMATSAVGTGKTTAELLDYNTYTDTITEGLASAWDFVDYPNDDAADNDYWGINPGENNGYPFLTWQGYDYLSAPTVITDAVTDIGGTTAVGNGNISSLGASSPTQYGMCWNTSGNPTIEDNTTDEGATNTTGAFTTNIEGLNECTTYFVRAYATNFYSENYGAEVSFSTNDETAPVPDVAELDDVIAECEVTDLTAPTATDNCAGAITGTHDATLPISTQGTTVVTWTYDDDNGNVSTQTQNVVINDVTAPIPDVAELDNITAECEVTDLTAPTATDNCAGAITGTHDATLPISTQGTTVVTWTYDDGNGNVSTQTQNVIIEDITVPAISCIDNQTVNADESNTYTVLGNEFDPSDYSDNCNVVSVTNDFNDSETLDGAQIPEGTTTINWTVSDIAGNDNSCSFEVTVNSYSTGIADLQRVGVVLYPNPVTHNLTIDLGRNQVERLSITDLTGRQILVKKDLNNIENLDVSNLDSGVYLISIQINEEVISARFVKQ